MSEPEADAAERRRRQRRIARDHHPDVGADPEQYLRLMRELDRSTAPGPGSPAPRSGPAGSGSVTTGAGSRLRRGVRRSRQVVRAVRARLPRRVPGARRYIDL